MKVLVVALGALMLASCGGGGGGDSGGTQATVQIPNPDRYSGAWTSDCNNHQQSIWAMANYKGTYLVMLPTINVYAQSNCTGSLVAKVTLATETITMDYVSTLRSLVQLSANSVATSIDVDKVRLVNPQNQQIVTGATVYDKTEAGVQKRCVNFSSTSWTCWPTGVTTATSTEAGLYVSGNDLYALDLSSTGVFTVNQHFRLTAR
jgi:hypothetical protein